MTPLIRIAAAFLEAMTTHPRSRRAVEETILDIRTERETVHDPMTYAGWLLHAAGATLRVAVHVLPLEIATLVQPGWIARACGLTCVAAAALVVNPWLSMSHTLPPDVPVVLLLAALLPQPLAVALPLSLFLTALWPGRGSSPSAGAQALVAATLVMVSLSISPYAYQFYRATTFAAVTHRPYSFDMPARGVPEMTVAELAGRAFSSSSDERTRRYAGQTLLMQAGLVGVAASFAFAGAIVARSGRRRRWPFALGLPVSAVAGLNAPAGLLIAAAVVFAAALWYLSTCREPGAYDAGVCRGQGPAGR